MLTANITKRPAVTIGKRTVDAAKARKADYFLWDDDLPGFGMKVTPAGARIYVFQYRMPRPGQSKAMPTRRITLGRHGPMTPDEARKEAKQLAALVTQGIDPRQAELDAMEAKDKAERLAEEKARLEGELVFEKVAARWLEEYELSHRPNSFGQAKVSINKYLLPELRGKPMPHIGKANLQAALDKIPAKQKATRQQVFAYASILWRWATERGDIAENPVPSMTKQKATKARDRVLTEDELATVWTAADGLRAPYGVFFKLLILTGQRREEVAGMEWAELDRSTATWSIPAIRAKNGAAQLVHLAPAMIEELDRLALAVQVKAKADKLDAQRWPKSGPVLTTSGKTTIKSYSQAKAELDTAITEARGDAGPLNAWRVHDLRRTLATGLQKLGSRFEVTEAVLNHVSGARSGVAGIYQRHDWKDEKRAALEAWARHVADLVNPTENTNVVPIATAQKSA
jgi:integrase